MRGLALQHIQHLLSQGLRSLEFGVDTFERLIRERGFSQIHNLPLPGIGVGASDLVIRPMTTP